MSVGGGWEAKGKLYYPLAQRQSHCVFSKAQKQPQYTCQAWMVVGSNLTSHAALLVCPSGNIQPVVDRHEFTGSENAACESRPGYL